MDQLEDGTLQPRKYVLLVYIKFMNFFLKTVISNDLKVIKSNRGRMRVPGLQHIRNPPHSTFWALWELVVGQTDLVLAVQDPPSPVVLLFKDSKASLSPCPRSVTTGGCWPSQITWGSLKPSQACLWRMTNHPSGCPCPQNGAGFCLHAAVALCMYRSWNFSLQSSRDPSADDITLPEAHLAPFSLGGDWK